MDSWRDWQRPPCFAMPAGAAFLLPDRPEPLRSDASPEEWLAAIEAHIEYVFQPIVNIHTGACYGLEALLRDHQALGFEGIGDLFDEADKAGILHQVDVTLREIAIGRFALLRPDSSTRLFLNLDNRVLDSQDYQPGRTLGILARHGLSPLSVCFEISERHELPSSLRNTRIVENYRRQTFRLAIDDFGNGFSGLKMLYSWHPDFIKIDRYFVSGIQHDNKKKLFVSHMVNLAHVLGVAVVAEGVENNAELMACKEIGCDMVQGYLVQRPTANPEHIRRKYDKVAALNRGDRRTGAPENGLIEQQIEALPTITVETPMSEVFETFRKNKHLTFFPVLNDAGEPLGLLREKDLKDFTYSRYGHELMSNVSYGRHLERFVSPCPVADIRTDAEKILETFSLGHNSEGILIVDEYRYVGFLSAASLLRVVNEKNLAVARDQNPLTKLPGNNVINRYLADLMLESEAVRMLAYFDFDNFKPFNDHYGFRQGDRAILLFAELMRKHMGESGMFIGHVGGDDFVAGARGRSAEEFMTRVRDLRECFRSDVESFYDATARQEGGIVAKDRDGNLRRFPLLSVSVAVAMLGPGSGERASMDDLVGLVASLKKEAKRSPDGVALASLA